MVLTLAALASTAALACHSLGAAHHAAALRHWMAARRAVRLLPSPPVSQFGTPTVRQLPPRAAGSTSSTDTRHRP